MKEILVITTRALSGLFRAIAVLVLALFAPTYILDMEWSGPPDAQERVTILAPAVASVAWFPSVERRRMANAYAGNLRA